MNAELMFLSGGKTLEPDTNSQTVSVEQRRPGMTEGGSGTGAQKKKKTAAAAPPWRGPLNALSKIEWRVP